MKTIYLLHSFVSALVLIADLHGQPVFESHLISGTTQSTESLFIIDLDHDGDQDILGAAAEYDNDVIWFRNDGGVPIQWTKIIIDGNFSGAGAVYAAYLNDDSLVDIIAGAKLGNQVAWWENGGSIPVNWAKRDIQSSYIFPHEVFAADLDLDGKTDVLAASSGEDEITWWKNEGGTPVSWTGQVIGTNFMDAKSVHTGDFNSDGLPDVVGACLSGNQITWWENEGGSPILWTEHPVTDTFPGAHHVQAIDLDKDGGTDILGIGYYADEISWWRNEGGNPVTWNKHVIATGFPRACIGMAIDLDNDDRYDVAGTSQNGNEVAWWRNEGGDPMNWTKHTIDGNFYRVWPLYAGDLDADGDNDVVAASGIEGNFQVKWYENKLIVGLNEKGNPEKSNDMTEISPNPVSEIMKVSFIRPVAGFIHIDLYTFTQRKIKTMFSGAVKNRTPVITLQMPELSGGLYFVKITSDSNVELKKIVVK